MSTTKKGRYIHRTAPYDVQLKKLWRVGRECGKLSINYRMGHSLEEMGVELRSVDWSRVIVRKSSSSPPSSPSSSPTASPKLPESDKSNQFTPSRSSSPTSPIKGNTDVIRFTSTEIKKEKDISEPLMTPVQPILSS